MQKIHRVIEKLVVECDAFWQRELVSLELSAIFFSQAFDRFSNVGNVLLKIQIDDVLSEEFHPENAVNFFVMKHDVEDPKFCSFKISAAQNEF